MCTVLLKHDVMENKIDIYIYIVLCDVFSFIQHERKQHRALLLPFP